MYCPSCGKKVNPDLSYCNQCGARIGAGNEPDPNALSESSFNLLVGSLLTIPIVGIGLILGLMVVMKRELGFRDEVVMSVVFLSFLLLLAAEAGFIWLMLSRTKRRKAKTGKNETSEPAQLNEPVVKSLAEPRPLGFSEPVPSVTDHTTRTLDPVKRGADR
jgi:hypothetical protein